MRGRMMHWLLALLLLYLKHILRGATGNEDTVVEFLVRFFLYPSYEVYHDP